MYTEEECDGLPPQMTFHPLHYHAPLPSVVTILDDPNSLPQLVALILERAGLTTREAAQRIGVQPETLRQYLSGRRKRPSVEWLARLAAVCGGRLVVQLASVPLDGRTHN